MPIIWLASATQALVWQRVVENGSDEMLETPGWIHVARQKVCEFPGE